MRLLLCVVIITLSYCVTAQTRLSLESMDDFKPQAGNWQIVGDVVMSRQVDVHQKPEPTTVSKKKKKHSKKDLPQVVEFTPGVGVLLNINDQDKKDKLITNWEHGDIELELEVMMPKGSNSGIYLQGRYEIQLLDSWGVKMPKFSDMGGIYQHDHKDFSKKLVGVPPTSNAAKAPGLWQKFKINFRAPRFDTAGNKTQNAKLIFVDLNGVRIHSNVEIAMPTGSPLSREEVPLGPIMIQGDHGPVAIRNFKYRLFSDCKVEMSGLTYKSYNGEYQAIEEFESNEPLWQGDAPTIDIALAGDEDNYAIVFSGSIHIPDPDDYTFTLGHSGGVKFVLDNNLVSEALSADAGGKIEETIYLEAGTFPFSIYNFKSAGWRAPRLGLYVQGSSTTRKTFHFYDSYPESPSNISPIYVDPGHKPRLLRGFVTFENDGPKLSHTIGVGTPDGVHYLYDLNSANLIGVWRGNFLDATPMWHNRGNATFIPRGAVQWRFLNQPLAQLPDKDSPFPEKADFSNFKPNGYVLDKISGLPVFQYTYRGVDIEDQIEADQSNTYIVHQISFSQANLTGWYYKLAQGDVKKMSDGSYAINDQQYYVNVLSGQSPFTRKTGNMQELVLPVDGSTIKYEIIW